MAPTAILVVEDDKIIAKGIERQLQRMGYALAGAADSGEEAVRKAHLLQPDLILMDINLGAGIDGVQAAGLIRAQLDVPVVFLTAHSDDATLQRAKQSNPFGYVVKPYDDKDLQTAIEIGVYRHQIEVRLRQNEQWLAAILGSIGDGVIATDAYGRVRFLNALAEQLTGWTQAAASGCDVCDVYQTVQEKSRQPVVNPVQAALATGNPVELTSDLRLLDATGIEHPIENSAAPLRDEHGKLSGAVLVFRDITERRRLEEHLRQAQKMEAIGQLAGGIAHDFNNIMTVITGFSELLLAGGTTPVQQREFVRNIHDAGQRAAALTQQIMAFSRKQMLVTAVLDLNAIVRDMGALVLRLIGADIELVTDTAADLGPIRADPTQISQVLLNLAANARDAMPHGGRLLITTANFRLEESITRTHPDVVPGRFALLSVTDTGAGIPADVLPHIFEPFFTTKQLGHGTGLGLATVFGIVKQSGGHIEVVSTVGKGTTFRVYLPLIDAVSPANEVEVARLEAQGHETILLVEDDELVRQMTALLLQQHGYQVLEASDGQAGLEVALQHAGTIHLLLTDLVMPRLSGRELAEQLRARQAAVRVLFMSGHSEDVVALTGVEAATIDFLQKPFTRNRLMAKIRAVLDRAG